MTISDYVRNEYQEIILYIFVLIFFGLLIPLIGGFAFRGFQGSLEAGLLSISDYLGTFLVYLFMIVASLFVIIFPIGSLLTIKKGELPATQPNPKWFRIFTVSWIFNAEGGALWQLSEALGFKDKKNFMRWSKNILRVFVFSILIFSVLGLLQVANPGLNVVGVPSSGETVALQISQTNDIIFGASLPAIAENGVLNFFLFLFAGIVAYFTSKLFKDKKIGLLTFFMVVLLVVSPLIGLGFMSFHNIIYGATDAGLANAFIFGFMASVLTIIFGNFLPALVWHFTNNLFIKLASSIEATEDIFFITIIVLAIIAMIWGSIEFLLWRAKKGKTTQNTS